MMQWVGLVLDSFIASIIFILIVYYLVWLVVCLLVTCLFWFFILHTALLFIHLFFRLSPFVVFRFIPKFFLLSFKASSLFFFLFLYFNLLPHLSPLFISIPLSLFHYAPSFIYLSFSLPLIHSPRTLPGLLFPPPLLFFYPYPFLTFLIFNLFLPGFHDLYFSWSFSLILPLLFLLNPFILSLSFRVFLLTSFHPSFHCQSFLLSNLLLKPNHCPPLPCAFFCLSCTRPSFLHPFLSLPSAPPLPFAPLCPK